MVLATYKNPAGLGEELQWATPALREGSGRPEAAGGCFSPCAFLPGRTADRNFSSSLLLLLLCLLPTPHSPSEMSIGLSIHHALPKSPTDPQVIPACTCSYCRCVHAPSFPDIILSDCPLPHTLTWQKSNSGDQLSPCSCPQAPEHYRRETQNLTLSVSLTSLGPLVRLGTATLYFSPLSLLLSKAIVSLFLL